MKKYKELLKKIICEKECNLSDFVSIDSITFENYGVLVYYEHYPYSSSNETEISGIKILNSELNAYMYESIC